MSVRYSLCMYCGRCPTREEQKEKDVPQDVCPFCGGQVVYAYREEPRVPNKKPKYQEGWQRW